MMTKSAGNVNFSTGTKTSLAIPADVQWHRLASSWVMRSGKISSGKPNVFQTESGIKLMLAPRSARALHLSSLKPHGMRNFPGSPSFSRSGYHQKDRKPSQNDKTEHGMEKTVQNQGQSPKMSKSESILKNQQSNRSRN
ncbi:hypothetical protein Tco_1216796 [Tanacetum coccineum]